MKDITIKNITEGTEKIGVVCDEHATLMVPMYYVDDCVLSAGKIPDDLKIKLKRLAKAWQKYGKNMPNNTNDGDENNINFDTIMSIVNDFIEYGIYTELEKFTTMNNYGKINFSATVKRCRPLLTQQGAIYLDYLTDKKRIDEHEIVNSVQILVLNDISKKLGWLIGFNLSLPTENIRYRLGSYLVPLLISEKNQTFNTRKLNLINLLINYIRMTNGKENSNYLPVCTAYNFWENILFDALGNMSKDELNKHFYVRHGYRDKQTNKIIVPMKPLMPDIAYKDDYSVIILDAKYYQKGFMPTNEDITKQFAYMIKAFGKWSDAYSYRNIFCLPTDEVSKYHNLEAVFGEDIASDDGLVPIELLYLNFEEMLEHYVDGTTAYEYIS